MKYAKLRGLIREKYTTEYAFAKAAGIPASVLSRCLTGKRQWRGQEIAASCCALGISLADAYQYNFFD
jgi:predicted transcriptional regulator